MDAPSAIVQKPIQAPDLATAPWTPRPPSRYSIPWSTDPRANFASTRQAWITDFNGVKSIMMHWSSPRGTLHMAIPVSAVGLGEPQIVPESDMAYQRASGIFGPAFLGDSNLVGLIVKNGRLVSRGFDIGLAAPGGATEGGSKVPMLFIYNKQMAVFWERPPASAEESIVQVWTPQSGKWTPFRVPGGFPQMKGIGSWILGTGSSLANGRVSPGQAERQKRNQLQKEGKTKSPKKRVDTDYWFRESKLYYPGTLFAIDTTSGKMITWQTGQGDSEILLIRDDNVIYRVDDSLYSARIQGTTIGTSQLLAQDEAVPDMHWAFTSRQ
jgi:hypothetical protein